jgi:hypothetical protein
MVTLCWENEKVDMVCRAGDFILVRTWERVVRGVEVDWVGTGGGGGRSNEGEEDAMDEEAG